MTELYIALWALAFGVAVAVFVATVRARVAVLSPDNPVLAAMGPLQVWLHWSLSYPVLVGLLGWSFGVPIALRGNIELAEFLMPAFFLAAVLVIGMAVLAYVRSAGPR